MQYIETPKIYKQIKVTRKFKFINRSGTSIQKDRASEASESPASEASGTVPAPQAPATFCRTLYAVPLRHFVACDILSHVTFFLINYQEEQFCYAQSLQYLLSLDDLLSPLMYSPQHLQCVNSSLGFELSFFIFLLFVNKRIVAQWCSQHHCALCRSQSSNTIYASALFCLKWSIPFLTLSHNLE